MIKRHVAGITILFLLFVWGSTSLIQPVRSAPTPPASPVDALIAEALGPSPLGETLRVLCDEIGGRPTGTPAMSRAVSWGVENFRRAGVDNVHTEKFTIPQSWVEGATQIEVTSPVAFEVKAVSIAWAPPTAGKGIEAPVLDVGEGTSADFLKAENAAKGSILLIHSKPMTTLDDLFNEYIRAPGIVNEAVRVGAAALVFMSTRPRELLYRHTNSQFGLMDRLPMAILAREDALRVARLIESRRIVRMRISLPNRVGGPFESENVIAEIRGSEIPDEVIILGAHLDSWELGTGALDNGCNAAMVIDVARAIHDAGIRPRRTLRFILFSGEEQGLLGSKAYVRMHRNELDQIVAVTIFDEGVGRVSGYSLGGRRDTELALIEILKPVRDWESNLHTSDAFIGTDNFDFLLEGIPTFVANQDPADYLPNYHASSDTLDKVDLRELKVQEAYAAVTVYGIAERPERIGKRQSRTQVEALMAETQLDQVMKTFGLWPEWESGQRGREK
ncbi:MAG: M20/M25/M40 family metallo-hydrolase [Acidobacteriia bacterium]|nr:M20/M25/M40 family metallo-hydrolase [Terriglobia bacterium]